MIRWIAFGLGLGLAHAAMAGEIADCVHDRAIEWAESKSTDTDKFFETLFKTCVPADADDEDETALEIKTGLRRALAEKFEEFLKTERQRAPFDWEPPDWRLPKYPAHPSERHP